MMMSAADNPEEFFRLTFQSFRPQSRERINAKRRLSICERTFES